MITDRSQGTILHGRWKLEDLIGRGGASLIYRAFDLETNDEVAVKLLRHDNPVDEDWELRLCNEAEATQSLKHPNIVRVFHHEADSHLGPYMVMEWVQGLNLGEQLKQARGPLQLEEVAFLLPRVCAGMAYVHEQGLLHRDLKPENILIARTGRVWTEIKLIDFGIMRKKERTMRLTAMGSTLGTPPYLSPEQARGREQVDHRLDIYALGVILFEVLTGRTPFKAATLYEYLMMHVTMPPPALADIDPSFREAVLLESLIEEMLAKEADDRPQDMQIVSQRFVEAFNQLGELRGTSFQTIWDRLFHSRAETPGAIDSLPTQLIDSIPQSSTTQTPAAQTISPVKKQRRISSSFPLHLSQDANGKYKASSSPSHQTLTPLRSGRRSGLLVPPKPETQDEQPTISENDSSPTFIEAPELSLPNFASQYIAGASHMGQSIVELEMPDSSNSIKPDSGEVSSSRTQKLYRYTNREFRAPINESTSSLSSQTAATLINESKSSSERPSTEEFLQPTDLNAPASPDSTSTILRRANQKALFEKVLEEISGVESVGLIDIGSGSIIDTTAQTETTTEQMKLFADLAKDTFMNQSILGFERKFTRNMDKPTDALSVINEFVGYTEDLIYYFYRLPTTPRLVLLSICSDKINIGMMLLQTKKIVNNVGV